MSVCVYVCVCVCIYIYIYVYIYMLLVSLDHYKGALFFVAVMVIFMWGKGAVVHTG